MASRDLVVAAAGASAPSDPNFKNVSLLLSGDGTNGSQNNTFVDSSTNNFTITRNGNTTQGSFSPYGNLWSNYFDGSGDYLTVPDNSAWVIDSDYTIEFWAYASSFPGQYSNFVSQRNSGATQYWGINWDTSTGWGFFWNNGGGETKISRNQNSPLNNWVHFAIVKSGTTGYMFLNGTQAGATFTLGSISDVASSLFIGAWPALSDYFNGYISNLRVVKGTALYTSNFTPSTTPLTAVSGTSLLTCQSNRFIDNSSNNFTLTVNGNTSVQRFSPFNPTAAYSVSTIGGSGYFDGTGDDLHFSAISLSGNFTAEAYIYMTAWSSNWNMVFGDSSAANYIGVKNTIIDVAINSQYISYNFTPQLNTWYHLAVTRVSNLVYVYINGASLTPSSSNSTSNSLSINRIGSYGAGLNFNGYISSARIVNGTAVYTSNFTPPTAPLTAITNTSLLCNFTNAGIPDAAMMNDLETVGNAQVSTSVKKYGTGSLYFDGTGDYLVMPPSPNFTFGTGDFTVECWVYVSAATPTANGIFQQGTSSFPTSTTNTVAFGTVTSGSVWQIYAKNTTTNSTATWTTGTWYHCAVVRYSGTTTLYINGTSVITVSSDTTNYTGTYFGVGAIYGATPYNHNGYIDDLRITKGLARYTANFVPPTQALPTN